MLRAPGSRLTRARIVAGTLLGALALTLVAGPGAADINDTRRRKAQADATARASAQRLDDLSAQLRGAVRALAAVERRIPAAQARLARVRGTLAAAQARDAELAARLARTRAQMRRTRADMAATQGRMAASRARIGAIARTAYQSGSLSELAAVLGAETPADLASRLAALKSTSRAQGALLTGLSEDRADLAAARATLRARAAEEARLKAAQEALVARIRGLEAQALAATTRLQALARERSAAASRVRAQRAAERTRYARAVQESRRLARRIEAQRRAAERRLAAQRRRQAARAAGQPHASSAGGSVAGSGGLLWPVPGRISTYAGYRINPVTGQPSCHAGIDVAAPYGTPIRAMASGVVITTTTNSWDGLTTVIAHGGGRTTWYSHQSRFGVRPGQYVSRGQVIGYVGSSGFSTGPHVQFDVVENGVPYDPMGWFGGPRRTVASLCPNGPAPLL